MINAYIYIFVLNGNLPVEVTLPVEDLRATKKQTATAGFLF